MFKQSNFEDEIYQSMEKQLIGNQLESKYNFNKLAKVADCLNNAAELFENAGMTSEAEEVSIILKSLANQLSK